MDRVPSRALISDDSLIIARSLAVMAVVDGLADYRFGCTVGWGGSERLFIAFIPQTVRYLFILAIHS